MRYFASSLTAIQTAEFDRLVAALGHAIFLRMRRRMAEECERSSPFGACRKPTVRTSGRVARQARTRGTQQNHRFRLLNRGDQVYTEIAPDASKATLQAIIREKASPESVLHIDSWRGYDGQMAFAAQVAVAANCGRCQARCLSVRIVAGKRR